MKSINEMDLVPLDKNGEPNLSKKQSLNAWRMILRLLNNIKKSMDYTYTDKKGNIGVKDVDGIIDYIFNSLQNITSKTIGKSQSENSSYKPQYKITKRELKQMINECVREVMQPSCS